MMNGLSAQIHPRNRARFSEIDSVTLNGTKVRRNLERAEASKRDAYTTDITYDGISAGLCWTSWTSIEHACFSHKSVQDIPQGEV